MREIECIIIGKVQGILFRDFVQKKAHTLGLNGFVENIEDGSVHAIAQGEEEALKKLIEYLHAGPILARVSKLEVVWRDVKGDYNDFEVRY